MEHGWNVFPETWGGVDTYHAIVGVNRIKRCRRDYSLECEALSCAWKASPAS